MDDERSARGETCGMKRGPEQKCGANQKTRKNSEVAQTLGITCAGEEIHWLNFKSEGRLSARCIGDSDAGREVISLMLRAKGELLQGVMYSSENFVYKSLGRKQLKNKIRPSRVAKRFAEGERKGHTLGICQLGGEHGRSAHALLYEQFGSCADLLKRT